MALMLLRSTFWLLLAFFAASGAASAQSHFFSSGRTLINPEPFFRRDARNEVAMLRPSRQVVSEPEPEIVRSEDGPTVSGSRAVLRRGVAYAPSKAPRAIKELIWAVNRINRLPYKWGGGHGSFRDNGYDCSGTISYALHYAGRLSSPLTSSGLMSWGQRGRGRWITIYARNGHVFATVAGLRLDAMGSSMGRSGGPRWYPDMRSTRGFVARSVPGL